MRYSKNSYGSCASSEGHAPSVPSRDEIPTPSHSTPSSPMSTPVGGKDLVQHDFAVVNLARVDVQEEGTGGGEDAVGLDHARAKEADVVVEDVGVDGRRG